MYFRVTATKTQAVLLLEICSFCNWFGSEGKTLVQTANPWTGQVSMSVVLLFDMVGGYLRLPG